MGLRFNLPTQQHLLPRYEWLCMIVTALGVEIPLESEGVRYGINFTILVSIHDLYVTTLRNQSVH